MTSNETMISIPFSIGGKQSAIPAYLLNNLMTESQKDHKDIGQTYKPNPKSSKYVTIFMSAEIKTHFFVGLEMSI